MDVAVTCPTDDDVAGYVAGELAAGSHRALASHLDSCERCRRLVSALAGSEPTLRSGDAAPAGTSGVEPGVAVGRFTLVRQLGHGSMGEVWAARDPELGREVALKLVRLRPGALGGEDTLRLRREAQAMARLNHPNVVAIYELGTDAADRVFCAMELVDGVTLRGWVATPRSWRAVLEVASAIGRGLVAAHAVGLVHRDVKPENILIAADGRTLVSDFGLARLEDVEDPVGADVPIDPTLTADGAVIGTPNYMAPEQLAGRVADTRSDQFAYCVMIYEALFGARPFDGETLDALGRAIARGPARPPELRGVPPGVVRALSRGLAHDPVARWPAMAPLVDELARAARRPRQRRIALAVGLGIALAATAIVVTRPAASIESPEAAVARAWNPEKAAALRLAFLGTGAKLAGERAASVAPILDAYRAGWVAQRGSIHPDAELGAAQLACSDRLEQTFDRVVDLFLAPTRRDVMNAPSIAERLEPVASCSDLDRLAASSLAPSTWAGRLAAYNLRELEVLQMSGRRVEALAFAKRLVAEAEQAGDPALLARARFDLGAAQDNGGHPIDAEKTWRLALQEAAAARDHYLVASTWLLLFSTTGLELGHTAEAAAMEPAVRAAVAQAGNDPNQLADLEEELGLVAFGRGDLAAARDHFITARDRRIAARGPDHPTVANDETNLGGTLLQLGQLDEATAQLERGGAIIRARFGEHHPVIANVEQNLAAIATRRKDWPGAERHGRAALEVAVATIGPDSPQAAKIRMWLAHPLREQKRFAEARAQLELARASMAKTLPETSSDRIEIDLHVAEIDEAQQQYAAAVELTTAVIARLRAASATPSEIAIALSDLAQMTSHESPVKALPIYDEALELYVQQTVRDPAADADELRELAGVALAAKRPAAALAWFARMPKAAEQLADLRIQLERAR